MFPVVWVVVFGVRIPPSDFEGENPAAKGNCRDHCGDCDNSENDHADSVGVFSDCVECLHFVSCPAVDLDH